MADKKWIQKAVNPKHKGYCTPMTKPTCTGHRRALALRFKAMAKERKKHENGGYITMDEWVDKVHQGCPDCALEALHEAMDVYEDGGEIYVRYEEGGAINPAIGSALSLGLNAVLPGSGAIVDPLMGIVNQIKQKQDMNKVLSDHFKSLNQSTNPYGNYEDGGLIYDGELDIYEDGGAIHINPKNKGKFTAWAKSHGMSVQEAASHVMANKDKYSSTTVKRANFAKNAAKFKHENGGPVQDTVKQITVLDTTLPNLPSIPKPSQSPTIPKDSGYGGSGSKSKSSDKLYEKELGGVVGDQNATTFKGNSHANGGIPVSLSGTPSTNPVAEVEGDEVSYNVGGRSYIFSKKLIVK